MYGEVRFGMDWRGKAGMVRFFLSGLGGARRG